MSQKLVLSVSWIYQHSCRAMEFSAFTGESNTCYMMDERHASQTDNNGDRVFKASVDDPFNRRS